MPIAVISFTFSVGMPNSSPSILVAPAPVIIIRFMSFILIPFSRMILPNAPEAAVIASSALVFIFLTTLPDSSETALVVVLPMSMPIIILPFRKLRKRYGPGRTVFTFNEGKLFHKLPAAL